MLTQRFNTSGGGKDEHDDGMQQMANHR